MPIDIIRSESSFTERKLDTTIPNPPNVDIKRKPIEEQLTHILEKILKLAPENNDDNLVIFNFEQFITYTFMLTKIPTRIAVTFVRTNPITASSGR